MREFRKDFLSYAFRPFFLLSAVAAIAFAGAWAAGLSGFAVMPKAVDPLAWHAHEMIVGFAMAALAGFTLTAVATWTGRRPVRGAGLLLLVLAWVVGRLAMWRAAPLPAVAVATVDLLFPVALLVVFGREVIGARNRRNYKVVFLVGLLVAGNLVYHAVEPRLGNLLMIHTLLILVALIGGRIVPNFTANWMRSEGLDRQPVNRPLVDAVALGLTAATGLAAILAAPGAVPAYLGMGTALAHAVRVVGWRGLQTVRNPLLLALHIAYWWLPVGYAMFGMAELQLAFTPGAAMHALTMGAIGCTIFAMLTRVPLGHTGRPLRAGRLTVVAYVLISAAVLARLAGSGAGGVDIDLVRFSAVCWCAAFAIFVLVYWPVLSRPRVDRT